MFITFEGLDFCGKSTQVKILIDYLEKEGNKVTLLREPGGTIISEKIRDIVLDKINLEMCIETELLLFYASRAQLVNEKILPELKKGNIVISDRFFDSSTAYQGYGRGLSINFINELNKFVVGKSIPNITFFLDLSIEEIEKRKALLKKENFDRIERSVIDFWHKVREGYLNIAKNEERFCVIDASKSIEEIHKIILSKIISLRKEAIK
ncbi:MAG TPA: dTMP kinase [Melioribacteraceae bacterium]|mgnify:CR=1 FL=1|nr:dTMP kinase [Melioribacteraceae bacterium]